MTDVLLWADNAPVDDVDAYEDAVRLSLERTLRQAKYLQQTYLALPMSMAPIVNRLFPTEVPEWSEGFCYAPGTHIPHDGACALICLLNKGHVGPCGYEEHLGHVDRTDTAIFGSGMERFLSWDGTPPTVSQQLGIR